MEECIKKTEFAGKVKCAGDKLRFSADIVINMFKNTSEHILHHVIKRTTSMDYKGIIMTGEFANFKIMQQLVQTTFEKRGVEVIALEDPVLTALRGACLFERSPGMVVKRFPMNFDREEPHMDKSLHQTAQTLVAHDDWNSCMNKEHGSAEWKCINCGDYMCKQCKKTHLMGKKTCKHYMLHIKDRDEEEATYWEVFCRNHKDKELDMYCITDQQAICTICSLTGTHAYHETEPYGKFASKVRSDLGLAVTKADKVFPQYEKNLEEIDRKSSEAKGMTQLNCQRIDSSLQGIISKLKENAEYFKAGEQKKMEAMLKSFTSESEDLKKQLNETKKTILDARRFLENCSERELIREAATHTEKLDQIKLPKSKTESQATSQLTWDQIHRKLTNNLFSKQ